MEKKEPIKISLKVFIIVALTVLILMGIIITKIFNNSIQVENKKNGNSQNVEMEDNKQTTELSDKVVNKENKTIEEEQQLSDEELFEKVSVSKQFLSLLIDNKNFEKQEFLDEEIPLFLWLLNGSIFKESDETDDFYQVAKESDIQKYAKQYFGKKENVDKLKDENGDVKIAVPSGFGIRDFKFSKIGQLENGNQVAIFSDESEESTGAMIYTIIFDYNEKDDSIIYKGFINELPDGIIYK